MKRSKFKIFLISLLAITFTGFLCGISLLFYWEYQYENNLILGEKITADFIENSSKDRITLKDELDKKYHLNQNSDVGIVVIDNGANSDILLNIYHKPLGPFDVFSQKRKEWFNEE